MLHLLDMVYTCAHLLLIGFNLFAWIWPRTRRLHLWCAGITLFCWIVLGIWYGFGYCPLTDWQWQVKKRLGEQNLPNSFIAYLCNNVLGMGVSESLVDIATLVAFALAIAAGVYVNFFRKTGRGDS